LYTADVSGGVGSLYTADNNRRAGPLHTVKVAEMLDLCVTRVLVTANVAPSSLILFTLMMEGIRSSETSIITRATRHHRRRHSLLQNACLHYKRKHEGKFHSSFSFHSFIRCILFISGTYLPNGFFVICHNSLVVICPCCRYKYTVAKVLAVKISHSSAINISYFVNKLNFISVLHNGTLFRQNESRVFDLDLMWSCFIHSMHRMFQQ
jgi:hypothetical protein